MFDVYSQLRIQDVVAVQMVQRWPGGHQLNPTWVPCTCTGPILALGRSLTVIVGPHRSDVVSLELLRGRLVLTVDTGDGPNVINR